MYVYNFLITTFIICLYFRIDHVFYGLDLIHIFNINTVLRYFQ